MAEQDYAHPPSRDFFSILKARDPRLAEHLDEIKRRGLEHWVNFQTPEAGSQAGYPHLLNVERIANRIVPDNLKDEFSPGEIFLLLSSIFFHDIGKTLGPLWSRPRRCPEGCFKNQAGGCGNRSAIHGLLGRQMVEDQGTALGLPDDRIAGYCALLVSCHILPEPPHTHEQSPKDGTPRKDGIPPKDGQPAEKCAATSGFEAKYRSTSLAPYGTLRIPMLASILRVADETDNSWTRALDDYWFPFQLQDRDHLGKAFRSRIEDVEFCHKGQCLILHVPDLEYVNQDLKLRQSYVESINKVKGDMEQVLNNWDGELRRVGIRFEHVYIEYQNQLFRKLPVPIPAPDANPSTEHESPILCHVVDEDAMAAVKDMLEAAIQLSLGSLGYRQFRWDSLEAQVGRPLTDLDRWLAERMADASDGAIVVTDAGEVRVDMKGTTPAALKEKIGIAGQGR